jgi:hypothetical protein
MNRISTEKKKEKKVTLTIITAFNYEYTHTYSHKNIISLSDLINSIIFDNI